MMQKLGVEYYLEPGFEEICEYEPEAFVEEILYKMYHARILFCGDNFTFGKKAAGNVQLLETLCARRGIRVVVVPMAHYKDELVSSILFCGDNFTFGKKAAGNVQLLETLCARRGIRVVVVPMAHYKDELVSSTRIRATLEAGDVPAVKAMLGRPYCIDFPVKHGKGLGRTLGFPTINQIYPQGFLQPKFGIYITRVCVDGRWYAGATGFGTRPTVNETGEGATCETFIPGYTGELYEQSPRVEFYEYIAPSRKFDTLQELTDCVNDAAARALAYFAPEQLGECD